MESFLIADEYIPKKELILVAKAILLAQDLRENSWVANSNTYTKNCLDSTTEAVKSFGLKKIWIKIIYNWITFKWNECQWWAKEVLNR